MHTRSHKVDRQSIEVRGNALNADNPGPVVVARFGGGLCPAVDVCGLQDR